MLKEEQVSTPEISKLEAQARQAHQQRRTRECVSILRALLQADPENAAGRQIQASIQKEIQRDLADAHALIEDSQNREDGSKYRKAAEIILLKIMYLDPENEAAKALLASGRALVDQQEVPTTAGPVALPVDSAAWQAEASFTTGTASVGPAEAKNVPVRKSNRLTVPIILGILAIVGAVVYAVLPSEAVSVSQSPADSAAEQFQPLPGNTIAPVVVTASEAPKPEPGPATPDSPLPPVIELPANPPQPTPSQIARFESPKPVTFVEAGTLSVTSPVTADVFMNGKPVGTTPISLQLIAGRHTLEYRRGDSRTVVTHEIKANQTTHSVVTFDMTVQINARPWAQVYVDGATRRPLGQTPLSNVSVPMGSLLVFENPNFATKSHRVAEGDTAIQVIFP
jgi:hypothetical protein